MRLDNMVHLCERAFLQRQALGLHSNIPSCIACERSVYHITRMERQDWVLRPSQLFLRKDTPDTHEYTEHSRINASICIFLVTDVSISNSKL